MMNISEALKHIAQHLILLYDDRDDLEDLARAADIALGDVLTGDNRTEFLQNILLKAHREEKVDNLVMQAIADHHDPQGDLRSTYKEYENAVESQAIDTPNILLTTFASDGTPPPPAATQKTTNAATTNETTTNTGGGSYVGGNVDTDGGEFIGRDKQIYGDEVEGDKVAGDKVAGDQITFRDYIVTQITHIPKRVQYGLMGIVAVIALVLAWQTFGQNLLNYTRDLELDKPFGIAIIDFGEKRADNQMYKSSEGSDISQWLYESLQTSYQQFDTEEIKNFVQIIHKTSDEAVGQSRKFAPLYETEDVARCNAAKDAALSLGAKMLVYGTLDKSNQEKDSAALEISFYISPEFQKWLSLKNIQIGSGSENIECLTMGEMLSVPLPLSDGVASTVTANEMNKRGKIFFWLTLGLIQEQLGEWRTALRYFEIVEDNLNDFDKAERRRYGADLVSFLIGQQYFRRIADNVDGNNFALDQLDLSLFDKAAENFQAATALHGQHRHRGEKGLGDVWHYLSTIGQQEFYYGGLVDEEIITLPNRYTSADELMPSLLKHRQNLLQALERATAHYEKAADHTRQLDDPYITLLLDYAFARSMWAEGQLLYISNAYDEAIPKMEGFVEAIAVGDDSILARIEKQNDDRLALNSYHMLGTTNFQLADITRQTGSRKDQIKFYEVAEQYLEQCLSKKQDAGPDKFIENEVAEKCQSRLDAVKIALRDAQASRGN